VLNNNGPTLQQFSVGEVSMESFFLINTQSSVDLLGWRCPNQGRQSVPQLSSLINLEFPGIPEKETRIIAASNVQMIWPLLRTVEYSRFEFSGLRFCYQVLRFCSVLFQRPMFWSSNLSNEIEKRWKNVQIEAELGSENVLERRSS